MGHLELTNGKMTDEFLQAFSSMTNRRGVCHTVWSHNAKTFRTASREIQKLYEKPKSQSQSLWDILDQDRIKSELSAKGIKQRFIPERSLEIESATPQASHEEDVPVPGGEKLQSIVVPAKSFPVPKRRLIVVLPDGEQGKEDVTACRTRSGRVVNKRETLDL